MILWKLYVLNAFVKMHTLMEYVMSVQNVDIDGVLNEVE